MGLREDSNVMRLRMILRAGVGLASALACAGVFCQEPADDDAPELGGGRANVSLTAAGFYTDNFFYSPTSPTSAVGSLVRPELGYTRQTTKATLKFGATGEYGTFDAPTTYDDYTDGEASINLGYRPTRRNGFSIFGVYKHGHDPFGLIRTEGNTTRTTDLDIWNQAWGGAHYRYGTPSARVNAEIGGSLLDKTYVSNRNSTEVLNYRSSTFDYTVFYNYSPKSAVVISFDRSDAEFDRAIAIAEDRSGQTYNVRTGLRWLATGKTSGDVRAGYRKRTFDNGANPFEGFSWQAGIQWSPGPKTIFELESGRSEQQSYVAGARMIDVQSSSLDLKQTLTARFKTQLGFRYSEADFVGLDRSDTVYGGEIGFDYLMARYIALVAKANIQQRDSNVPNRDFDRWSVFAGLKVGR
jgi:hypothetical protein